MRYKVLTQRGTKPRFEIVDAPDIQTAERTSGGIVVSLVAID